MLGKVFKDGYNPKDYKSYSSAESSQKSKKALEDQMAGLIRNQLTYTRDKLKERKEDFLKASLCIKGDESLCEDLDVPKILAKAPPINHSDVFDSKNKIKELEEKSKEGQLSAQEMTEARQNIRKAAASEYLFGSAECLQLQRKDVKEVNRELALGALDVGVVMLTMGMGSAAVAGRIALRMGGALSKTQKAKRLQNLGIFGTDAGLSTPYMKEAMSVCEDVMNQLEQTASEETTNNICEKLPVKAQHTSDLKSCILQASLASLPITLPLLGLSGIALARKMHGAKKMRRAKLTEGMAFKPPNKVIREVERLNKKLRETESIPDFNDKSAYTSWLIQRQKSGSLPENPYGYFVAETIERTPGERGGHYIEGRYEVQPRTMPPWINEVLHKRGFDNKSRKEYVEWVESYYQKSGSYPPGHLKYVEDSMSNQVSLGLYNTQRDLDNVTYSLGGERQFKNADEIEEYYTQNDTRKGSTLLQLIENLDGKDQWIDAGAGHGWVMEDAITMLNRNGQSIDDIPHTLAISYRPNKGKLDTENFILDIDEPRLTDESLKKKHKVLDTRLFQDIPNEELGKPKLITDFYGVFNYSTNPADTINRYTQVLDKQGTVGLLFHNTITVKTGDRSIPFAEWLTSVSKGQLDVKHGKGWTDSDGTWDEDTYMLIQNPSGKPADIPDLQFVGFQEGYRVFRPTSDIVFHE